MITSVTSQYLAVVIAHIGSQNRKLLRTARSLIVSRSIRKGGGGSVPPRCRPPWIQTPGCRPHVADAPMDADPPWMQISQCRSPWMYIPWIQNPTWMQTPVLDADPPPGCRAPLGCITPFPLDAEPPPHADSPRDADPSGCRPPCE